MKKASIISFQFADNYGAILQIYALSKVLESKNVNVDVINFSPIELAMPYSPGINVKRYIQNRGLVGTIRAGLIKLKYYSKNKHRQINFQNFKDEFLSITTKEYTKVIELFNSESLKKYDYYIVGSDQVWNPDFYRYAKEAYFLNFAPKSSTKISYAASIAKKLNDENKTVFHEELKNFDYISVREDSAKNQIKNLTEKKIQVTLDPTLLLTKRDWIKLFEKKEKEEKYIFVYDLVMSSTIVKLANKLSKEMNAKVICYSNGKLYDNLLYSFDGVNPKEFLRLIDDADFIITSSFHGVAFSLALEKQFYTVPHPTRGSRMIDLLVSLGLEDLLVTEMSDDGEGLCLNKIDYSDVNSKLNKMRNDSVQFLCDSLQKYK